MSIFRLMPLVCCGLIAAGLPVLTAEAGPYVEVTVGFPSDDPATLFDDDDDTDFDFDLDTQAAYSGAIGWDTGLLRSDLELTFRDTEGVLLDTDPPSATAGSGDFDSISLMVNLYADVPIAPKLRIFAGGGVGGVRFEGETSGGGDLDDFDDEGYGYAWQLRGGLAYEILPRLNLTAGYRYWRSGEIDFDGFELEETEVHAVELGLRLTF